MLLKAWQANIDLQPVYNYYMTAYLSKSENSASEAMKQAIQEIKLQNFSVRVAMKILAHLFVSDRCQLRRLFVFVYQNYG